MQYDLENIVIILGQLFTDRMILIQSLSSYELLFCHDTRSSFPMLTIFNNVVTMAN